MIEWYFIANTLLLLFIQLNNDLKCTNIFCHKYKYNDNTTRGPFSPKIKQLHEYETMQCRFKVNTPKRDEVEGLVNYLQNVQDFLQLNLTYSSV